MNIDFMPFFTIKLKVNYTFLKKIEEKGKMPIILKYYNDEKSKNLKKMKFSPIPKRITFISLLPSFLPIACCFFSHSLRAKKKKLICRWFADILFDSIFPPQKKKKFETWRKAAGKRGMDEL